VVKVKGVRLKRRIFKLSQRWEEGEVFVGVLCNVFLLHKKIYGGFSCGGEGENGGRLKRRRFLLSKRWGRR
jgi:hypothetical protein